MIYNKLKHLLPILFIIIFFSSCSRKEGANETIKDESGEKQELVDIDKNNLNETDEDIFKVDYKEFYDELSSNGEWVEVTEDELGIELDKGTASGEKEIQKDLVNLIFGVNNAYAKDVDAGAFFVWKPSTELAVTAVVADEPVQYTPYVNGQWLNTDAGWYFKAPTASEEIVHHYGRWTQSPSLGWVWIPGRVWAPAWVDWREDDNYVAWAPVPPTINIVSNVLPPPVILEDRYVVVEKRYFVEPVVYQYIYPQNKNKVRIIEMSRPEGVVILNNQVVVRGPSLVNIEKVTGRTIGIFNVVKVNDRKEVKFSSDRINVYVPVFKKSKVKSFVNKPNRIVRLDAVKERRESTGNRNDVKRSDSKFEKDKDNFNEKNFNKGNKNKGNDDDNDDDGRRKDDKGKENNDRNKRDNNKDKGSDNKSDKNNNSQKSDDDSKKSGNSGNKDGKGKK